LSQASFRHISIENVSIVITLGFIEELDSEGRLMEDEYVRIEEGWPV